MSPELEKEEYLVNRCKRNDNKAQKALYEKYLQLVLAICVRYISNSEDARELAMDSFIRFFNNIHQFTWRGEGSTSAWLKRIAINNCLMHLRKRHTITFPVDCLETSLPESNVTPIEKLSVKEILEFVHQLPEGYKMVFNLYVFEEMSHKEIGAILGITESTSKSQLHRARAILQKKLNTKAKETYEA